MGIGSLSGATLDSTIVYLENDPTPSEAVHCVIYHVGTKKRGALGFSVLRSWPMFGGVFRF